MNSERIIQDVQVESLSIEELDGVSSLSLLSCFSLTQEEFEKLRHLPQLISLTIDYSSNLSDLSFLQSLTYLESLSITRCYGIEDLSPIRTLTKLQTLSLASTIESHITDLSAISELLSLRSLNLTNAKTIESLNFLLPLIHLEELTADFCSGLRDTRALAHLVHLKKLSMRGCPFASPPPLEIVQHLTHFADSEL